MSRRMRLGLVIGALAVAAATAVWAWIAFGGQRRPEEPEVRVVVRLARANVNEVDSDLAAPLSSSLSHLGSVARVRAVSRDGELELVVTARVGSDTGSLRAAVRSAVAHPPRSADAAIAPESEREALVRVTFASEELALAEIGLAVHRDIEPRIRAVPGVADVELCGQGEPAVRVVLEPARMVQRSISLAQVVTRLRQRRDAHGDPLDALRELTIAEHDDGRIALGDVALLERGALAPECLAWSGSNVVSAIVRIAPGGGRARAHDEVMRAIRDVIAPAIEVREIGAGARVVTGRVERPAGMRLEEGWELVAVRLGPALRALPGVSDVLIEESAAGPTRVALAYAARESDAAEVLAVLRTVREVPGLAYSPDGRGLVVRVIGPERDRDLALAERARSILLRDPTLLGAEVTGAGEQPSARVSIDREAATRLGVAETEIDDAVAAATDPGFRVGQIEADGGALSIVVRLGAASVRRPDSLSGIVLAGGHGATVALSEVVRVELRSDAASLLRCDGERCIEVRAFPREPAADLEAAFAPLQSELQLPAGVRLVSAVETR